MELGSRQRFSGLRRWRDYAEGKRRSRWKLNTCVKSQRAGKWNELTPNSAPDSWVSKSCGIGLGQPLVVSWKWMPLKICLPIEHFKKCVCVWAGRDLLDLKKKKSIDALKIRLWVFFPENILDTTHILGVCTSLSVENPTERRFHEVSLIYRNFWKQFNSSAFQIEQMNAQKNEG